MLINDKSDKFWFLPFARPLNSMKLPSTNQASKQKKPYCKGKWWNELWNLFIIIITVLWLSVLRFFPVSPTWQNILRLHFSPKLPNMIRTSFSWKQRVIEWVHHSSQATKNLLSTFANSFPASIRPQWFAMQQYRCQHCPNRWAVCCVASGQNGIKTKQSNNRYSLRWCCFRTLATAIVD